MATPPGIRFFTLLFFVCLFCSIHPSSSSPVAVPADESPSLSVEPRAATYSYDVVIYGNTAAAMAAAIQVKRMKKTVAIVFPGGTLGGMTTSGLGWTDSKNGNAIGGISRQFFAKVWYYYSKAGAWKQETRANYLSRKIGAQPGPAIDESKKVQWTFEPKVAESIWETWMSEGKIPLYRNQAIVRSGGVVKNGATITSFKTDAGNVFKAKMFIDAGYEGDLMETAGISYRVGRESKDEHDESLAGMSVNINNNLAGIDPYVTKGSSASGLLPGIQRVLSSAESVNGKADPNRLQSFNFRLCLTKTAAIRSAFSKPADYKESDYEILFRYIEAGYKGPFFTYQLMPNIKTDTNAAGQVSTDLMGGNYDGTSNYAEDSYEKRAATALKHKRWAQGLLWTLAYHTRVPQTIRTSVSAWGYAKDEWVGNSNWPYEIYLREGRRMNGLYTVTQGDAQASHAYAGDSVVGMGSYSLDVHQVERVVIGGKIYDEGQVHVANPVPFAIPYKAIVPAASDATNFLNPVTMSSTHIAFGAIRMEPTYMILAQSAATAAVMAIEQGVKVQDVNRAKLTARLKADGQVLSL